MDLSDYRFLVVDDIRFTRVTVVKLLGQLGAATVLEAGDGAVAQDLLVHGAAPESGSSIDCVITDLEMPRLDGLGLLRAIRGGDAGPRATTVIILTGYADFARLGAALLLDVDAVLTKPVSRQALELCFSRRLGPRGWIDIPLAAPDFYRTLDLAPVIDGNSSLYVALEDELERELPMEQIRPEMLLARDLLFLNGRLLLPAGTRLSARILRTLNELAPVADLPPTAWVRL